MDCEIIAQPEFIYVVDQNNSIICTTTVQSEQVDLQDTEPMNRNVLETNQPNYYVYTEGNVQENTPIKVEGSSEITESVDAVHNISTNDLYSSIQLPDGTQVLCQIINDPTAADTNEPNNLDKSIRTEDISDCNDPKDIDTIGHASIVNGKKCYTCAVAECQREYTSISSLRTHYRSHTGFRPYKCEMCKHTCNTRYALKTHIRIHTGDRPYKCRVEGCAKSFKTSGCLSKHSRTHTGFRPFKCTVGDCDMSFAASTTLKIHVRTHTGERPHKCSYPQCNRTFTSLTNLNNHERIHRNEKPYECLLCNRRFTEYSSLFKHRRVHMAVVTCPICEKTYKRTFSLVKHIQANHPEEEEAITSIKPITHTSDDIVDVAPPDSIMDDDNETRFENNIAIIMTDDFLKTAENF